MHVLQQIGYIERFHLLFLVQLGQKLDKRFYALKGGCNLRFFLKSIRYSEDMDLDVQTIPVSELRGLSITHKYHTCTARFQPSLRSASRFHPLHRVIVPGGPSLFLAR